MHLLRISNTWIINFFQYNVSHSPLVEIKCLIEILSGVLRLMQMKGDSFA
jgi:hypothetical protein